MTKPIIIAICGKSAVGKDTAAKELYCRLQKLDQDCGLLVSDTTRPIRAGETEGVDYNFINDLSFLKGINKKDYLEWATFKGWYYGTQKSQLTHKINIGVFNPAGVNALLRQSADYIIVPILLTAPLFTRLYRSYKREHSWKMEFLRRAWHDYKDFINFEDKIRAHKHWRILDNYSSPVNIATAIIWHLKEEGLF